MIDSTPMILVRVGSYLVCFRRLRGFVQRSLTKAEENNKRWIRQFIANIPQMIQPATHQCVRASVGSRCLWHRMLCGEYQVQPRANMQINNKQNNNNKQETGSVREWKIQYLESISFCLCIPQIPTQNFIVHIHRLMHEKKKRSVPAPSLTPTRVPLWTSVAADGALSTPF